MAQVKEFIVYSATKAEFEAQVASGEVDNTQIGVIAETGEFWGKGNYHPLVDLEDYLKKTDAVELAKDLTGSLEATPEEFVFRASAGTKSIRDESAVIRRIKGNTSVWGQYAKNPIFADGTTNWASNGATLSVNSNGGVNFVTTSTSSQSINQVLSDAIPKGHKVLIVIDYKRNTTTSLDVLFYLRKSSGGFDQARIYRVADSNRRVDSVIITTTDTISTTSESLLVHPMMNGASGLTAIIYSINVFDLTAIFGAGNEPTTLAKFKEVYPESYYPYCAPEVRSMRATGIETIGTNAFNKDDVVGGRIQADGSIVANDVYSIGTIEVLPNQSYYLKDVANGAYVTYSYALYDSNGKHLYNDAFTNATNKPNNMSGRVTIPMNARFMKVCVYNDYLDSCCVHLVHTGIQNGTYTPFEKHVRMLPDITTYFPDGMHGIGEVYDEINEENAVKRFGVVDLGTLSWYRQAPNGTYLYGFFYTYLDNRALTRNVACKYPYGSLTTDKTIVCNSVNTIIYIIDSSYEDVDAFKTAMSGVMLAYELAEPIVTSITEPLQLDYKVADFGTEKMLHNLPSSPFRADIVYQFNAADRIRDNGRNIERIENSMATMEYVENYVRQNMPTVAATATPKIELIPSDAQGIAMAANTVYNVSGSTDLIGITNFVDGIHEDGTYDDVWVLRFYGMSVSVTILPPVFWEDGTQPSFSEESATTFELTFRKTGLGYLGSCKKYK